MKIICKWMGIALLALPTLFATNVMAQVLKKPTLEDLLPGGETYRIAENKWYQWYGDAACLELGIDSIKGIWAVNGVGAKAGENFTVITLKEANKLLAEKELGKLRNFYSAKTINTPHSAVIGILLQVDPLLLLNTGKYRVLIDWKKKELIWNQPCPAQAANEDWNEVSRHLAYTLNNNLYVMTNDGQTRQVTTEAEGIVCGQSVHRNEFGINKGTYWSPQGNLLAFYRMDESMVTQYPLVDITARIGELNNVRYPMAGMTSHKVTVGIYNTETQKTVYLNTGDPTDRYFTNISWAPDAKSIYLIELNRDQNHAQLVQYDAVSGQKMGVLYEEKHTRYVEPQHPLIFLPWDDSQFIYQTQRDGFNHLYVMDTKTKLKGEWKTGKDSEDQYCEYLKTTPLTEGNWLVQDVLGFNASRKEIVIASTEVSPLQTNIFSLDVKNGKRTLIGIADGTHQAKLSASGTYLIDYLTSNSVPREISILPTTGKKGVTLFTATDPLKEGYNLPEITIGTIKAADGETDLYYRLIKPVNFDPNKKYPAIIYVYGGPHAQMIHNTRFYDARGWDLYMAQQGYVMLTVDNRGSDNRGIKFENCTFRHLGVEEMKDQVEGAKFLQSLPYVDADKIGVHGWSFGGFMTTNLMLTYPDIFKVGVAGGPVIDWQFYEVMYGERYMDTPQTNPEGYKGSNLRLKAGNLKGRLEIIIGGMDPPCVPQHSISFLRACINAGTHPDFFIYPEDGHNMMGRDRVHLHEHITRYFLDHLK